MADWSWKQAIAERVLNLVNASGTSRFTIQEVYSFSNELSNLFPRNQHVKEKMRQTLQKLRNDGILIFHGSGNYELNLEYEELESEFEAQLPQGRNNPRTQRVQRTVRLRNTLLAAEIKRRYHNICQLCRIPVTISASVSYAEAHHLRPLGYPHFGPDIPGNIIVLCPNHHILFNKGAVCVDPGKFLIRHRLAGEFAKSPRLFVEDWHSINRKYLIYHNEHIFATG